MDHKAKNLIFMFPNECMRNNGSKLVKLKHPLTGDSSYFLVDKKERKVFEVQKFDEKHRSWFFKRNVISDGSIKIVTPYNPVFLVLPYLMKAEKNIPLDQLLEDENYPDAHLLSDVIEDLACVADRIGPENLNVWKYNESSTLEWLTLKVDKLAKSLFEKREKASLTVSVTDNKDLYRVLAFGVLSDCLPKELSVKLKSHLKLPETSLEVEGGTDSDKENKRTKVDESITPQTQVKKAAVVKQSAKEKALAKSAKGSKSITSFFTKK